MYTIKTEKLREFIENKKEEWTVFACGPTDGVNIHGYNPNNLPKRKIILFNLEQNKLKVIVDKINTKYFTSVTEAVEYFNNEEWCKWI
jgi:hypothetical protein